MKFVNFNKSDSFVGVYPTKEPSDRGKPAPTLIILDNAFEPETHPDS